MEALFFITDFTSQTNPKYHKITSYYNFISLHSLYIQGIFLQIFWRYFFKWKATRMVGGEKDWVTDVYLPPRWEKRTNWLIQHLSRVGGRAVYVSTEDFCITGSFLTLGWRISVWTAFHYVLQQSVLTCWSSSRMMKDDAKGCWRKNQLVTFLFHQQGHYEQDFTQGMLPPVDWNLDPSQWVR